MAAGTGQSQNEHIVFDAVDEQPVWLDVTFTMADPIASQSMVSVFLRERFPTRSGADDIIQKINVEMPFYRNFQK